MTLSTGVVVVTYESHDQLGGLLGSLRRHEPNAPVVVVDNGSLSGPPDPGHAALVQLGENCGYGAACNAGAGHLRTRHDIALLGFVNPDVRLVGPSLSELTQTMQHLPAVGIATGPLVDAAGQRRPSAWGQPSMLRAFWFGSGWRLPRLRALVGRVLRRGPFTSGASMVQDDVAVDGFVVGGAMVVRMECFEQLGGFDEDFFMFGEDMDLCQRAREAGWEIRVLPCTPIIHEGGGSSTGVTEEQRWSWYVEGMRTYAAKHLSRSRARRIDLALRVGRRLSRGRRAAGR